MKNFKPIKKYRLKKNKPFFSPRFDSSGSYTGSNSDIFYGPDQDADDL